MSNLQLIALVCITLLPVFGFIALKDGIGSMFRVLSLVLGVFAWILIVALGVLKLVP